MVSASVNLQVCHIEWDGVVGKIKGQGVGGGTYLSITCS